MPLYVEDREGQELILKVPLLRKMAESDDSPCFRPDSSREVSKSGQKWSKKVKKGSLFGQKHHFSSLFRTVTFRLA